MHYLQRIRSSFNTQRNQDKFHVKSADRINHNGKDSLHTSIQKFIKRQNDNNKKLKDFLKAQNIKQPVVKPVVPPMPDLIQNNITVMFIFLIFIVDNK